MNRSLKLSVISKCMNLCRPSSWCSCACCWPWSCRATRWCWSPSCPRAPGSYCAHHATYLHIYTTTIPPGGPGWTSSSCTSPSRTSVWASSPCPRTSSGECSPGCVCVLMLVTGAGRWRWPGRRGCWPASSSGSCRWWWPTPRPTCSWRSASTDTTPSPTPWPSRAAVSNVFSELSASSAKLPLDY